MNAFAWSYARRCILALLTLTSLPACVTGHGNSVNQPTPDTLGPAKAGTKVDPPPPVSSPGAAGLAPQGAATAPTAKIYTSTELTAFVKAQRAYDAAFGPAEHELVGTLAKAPAPGSLEEAALALGLVKSALHPLGKEDQTFVESDLDKAPDSRTIPLAEDALTVESLAREHDINLADALAENPLLQGSGVAKAFFAAASRPGNTAAFKAEITAAIKNQAHDWQSLSQELNSGDGETLPPQADGNATTLAPAATDGAGALPPDPAELHSSDASLGEAQALADRGDFKAAIRKAQAIDQTSPLYSAAQDKVKEFSNRAVQDLRKKAAQAFQSAMPLNDKKTRAQYLQQAKSYLEDAITNYPQAAQLPTVRDNLRVIAKDLEQSQPH